MSSKSELIFFATFLIGVICFHFQYLTIAHYWDEAWVYAPAIRSMNDAIPSVLPGVIPVELSRGHPLFFQFFGGIWAKIFGDSNAALHTYALSISLLVITLSFCVLKDMVNGWTALFATALLTLQPMFLVQMAMVYPENLMTLGVILAFFAYVRNKDLFFALGLSIAIYSKESAIVFFIAFLSWDVLRILREDTLLKSLKKYILPLAVLVSHPLLLFLEYGWFLYPEHVGFVSFDVQDVKYNLRKVFRVLFENQNRGWIIYPVIIAGVLIKKFKHWGFNLLLLGIGFSAYKVLVWKWVVPNALFILIMIVAAVSPILIWVYTSKKDHEFSSKENLVGIGYISIIGFVVFSAMNFFSPRYLIVILTITFLIIGVVVGSIRFPNWAIILVFSIGVLISTEYLFNTKTASEIDLGLYNEILVQQKLVDWSEANISSNQKIATNFITSVYLKSPQAGYLERSLITDESLRTQCSANLNEVDVLILTSTGPYCNDSIYQESKLYGFTTTYSDTIGDSYAVVLKRN